MLQLGGRGAAEEREKQEKNITRREGEISEAAAAMLKLEASAAACVTSCGRSRGHLSRLLYSVQTYRDIDQRGYRYAMDPPCCSLFKSIIR